MNGVFLFAESPNVAHLVQWGTEPSWRRGRKSPTPLRSGWVSPCGYSMFVPAVRYPPVLVIARDERSRPWCKGCLRWARRCAASFIDAGLIAEVAPGTVVQP